MTKVRRTRTDDELAAASEHVLYEIEMLFGALTELERVHREYADGAEPTITENNALLESWAVHVRNLDDFAFGEKTARLGDVLAVDYFHDGEWASLRPEQRLGRERGRVAEEVVHLTYARLRVTPEAKVWQLGDVTDWIGRHIIRPFVEHVPASRVLPEFRRRSELALSSRPGILVP